MTLRAIDFMPLAGSYITDQQLSNELAAQRRLFSAVVELASAVNQVNESSMLVHIEASGFESFLNNELPSPEYWDDMLLAATIGESRNG